MFAIPSGNSTVSEQKYRSRVLSLRAAGDLIESSEICYTGQVLPESDSSKNSYGSCCRASQPLYPRPVKNEHQSVTTQHLGGDCQFAPKIQLKTVASQINILSQQCVCVGGRIKSGVQHHAVPFPRDIPGAGLRCEAQEEGHLEYPGIMLTPQ